MDQAMPNTSEQIAHFVQGYLGTLRQLADPFADRDRIFLPHHLTPFKIQTFQCSDGVVIDFVEPDSEGPLAVIDSTTQTMGEVLHAITFGGIEFTARRPERAKIVPALTAARLTAQNSRLGKERRVYEIQLWWQSDVQQWTEEVPQNLAVERSQQQLLLYSLGFGAHSRVPSRETIENLVSVCDEYELLIVNSNAKEEKFHQFLYDHPILLSAAHETVISKQEIGCGREYEIDFVIREQGPQYLIVEIEKPSTRIMTKAGDFTADFNHAERQMIDFLGWIESNLQTARTAMPDIANPRGLIVAGRKDELDEPGRARLSAKSAATRAKYEFLCFDDLLDRARRLVSLLKRYTN